MIALSTIKGWWPFVLDGFARVLAILLFALFALLLWQSIEIGSANSTFQRVSLQIATLEPSMAKLESDRRAAELRVLRLDMGAPPPEGNALSVSEARQGLVYAAADYAITARRYYIVVCDAGNRLTTIGFLPRIFMPARDGAQKCPPLSVDLKPEESGGADPTPYIQMVRIELEHYGVLANSYVLPILFGMLGALVFALRDMVLNPANMGQLPIVVGYLLRIFLGAIFGLIIGYVNVGSAPTAGLAASPLLISLVAGFSTDAVISLLERLALAFDYDRDRKATT